MPQGIIKFFNDEKGYGFIESDSSDTIFVHYSSIRKGGCKTLREGMEVRFDVREGQRGLEAVDVSEI
jgi:CspA family cold shock protein